MEETNFKKELEVLINKHSIENKCDMPDFLLAEMVCRFISVVGPSVKKNLDWHGCDSVCHPNANATGTDETEYKPLMDAIQILHDKSSHTGLSSITKKVIDEFKKLK